MVGHPSQRKLEQMNSSVLRLYNVFIHYLRDQNMLGFELLV